MYRHPRIRLRSASLLVAAMLAGPLVGGAAAAQIASDARPASPSPTGCAMVELTLHAPQSLTVAVPEPVCGPVRVRAAGPARYVAPPAGSYTMWRAFEVPVVVENAGDVPLRAPIELRVDSISPVRGGRQLGASHSRELIELAFWAGREMQQPWRFGPERSGGADGRGQGREAALPAGARTDVRIMSVGVHPLMHTVRVWLDVRGLRPPPPSPPAVPLRPPLAPLVLDAAAERLLAGTGLPAPRIPLGFRDTTHQLLLFTIDYGGPQDCPAGCFFSRALGLSYGRRAGWLRLEDYQRGPALRQRVDARRFVPTHAEAERFGAWIVDTLGAAFGERDAFVRDALLPVVLESPHVPRALLRHQVDRLLRGLDGPMALALVALPAVRRDVELLTDLALLPGRGFEDIRTRARSALRELAPSIVRAPSTTSWTLFVLAQTLHLGSADSVLAVAIAAHPRARNDLATLTVLAEAHAPLRARTVAAVRASPRVRAMLTARFARPSDPYNRPPGAWLLDDPEFRGSRDALLVLGNMALDRDQDLVWTASRLLPESAKRRYELPHVPVAASDAAPARPGAPR